MIQQTTHRVLPTSKLSASAAVYVFDPAAIENQRRVPLRSFNPDAHKAWERGHFSSAGGLLLCEYAATAGDAQDTSKCLKIGSLAQSSIVFGQIDEASDYLRLFLSKAPNWICADSDRSEGDKANPSVKQLLKLAVNGWSKGLTLHSPGHALRVAYTQHAARFAMQQLDRGDELSAAFSLREALEYAIPARWQNGHSLVREVLKEVDFGFEKAKRLLTVTAQAILDSTVSPLIPGALHLSVLLLESRQYELSGDLVLDTLGHCRSGKELSWDLNFDLHMALALSQLHAGKVDLMKLSVERGRGFLPMGHSGPRKEVLSQIEGLILNQGL